MGSFKRCFFIFLYSSFVLNRVGSKGTDEGECNAADKNSCERKSEGPRLSHNLYTNSDVRWLRYLNLIEEAVTKYKTCQFSDCTCYLKTLAKDLKPWKKSGIKKHMIDSARDRGTFYQIIDHRLYREENCMFPFRCSGVEHFVLQIIHHLPNTEFLLNTRDWPQIHKSWSPLPVLSFSKTAEDYYDIMYPAWTFWEGGPAIGLYPTGLGRWDLHRESLKRESELWSWERKKALGFFRGSRTNSERDALVLLSRAQPNLVDAQYTKNQAWKSDADTLGVPPASEVSLEEHCHYRFLFNFRGVAASFRLKHLFLCRSVVLHVGDQWLEFFYPNLKPWVHYVPVPKDATQRDLEDILEFLKENDEVAQQIADRGFDFIWNHLKMEDISCYWKKLLVAYAKLMDYEPVLDTSLQEIRVKN